MAGEHTVQILLDQEVLEVFCRRGRRRLKDIQSQCQAALRLDRSRGVLYIRGKNEAISDVRKHLQMLTGPCIGVTAAAWAEFMRSRTNANASEAAVASIQTLTGCRIHIERNVLQVQLLGPQESIDAAQQLVRMLEDMCIQETIDIGHLACLDPQMLQKLADEFGVTLSVEGSAISVLGIARAVFEAAEELRHCGQTGIAPRLIGKPSESSYFAIKAALAELRTAATLVVGDEEIHCLAEQGDEEPTTQGAVLIGKLPPSTDEFLTMQPMQNNQMLGATAGNLGICMTCGRSANFCVNCGNSTRETLQCAGVGCPKCGIVKFCMFCGHPTEKASPHIHNQDASQAFANDRSQVPRTDKSVSNTMMQMVQMPMQYAQSRMQMPDGNGIMMCIPYMMPVAMNQF